MVTLRTLNLAILSDNMTPELIRLDKIVTLFNDVLDKVIHPLSKNELYFYIDNNDKYNPKCCFQYNEKHNELWIAKDFLNLIPDINPKTKIRSYIGIFKQILRLRNKYCVVNINSNIIDAYNNDFLYLYHKHYGKI